MAANRPRAARTGESKNLWEASKMRLSPAFRTILAAMLPAGVLCLACGDTPAGTVTFSLDAPTLQSLLHAVTPYDVVVGKGGLSETFTLSNPRDVRFAEGKIRLRVDCRGTPLPIEDVLEPSLSVQWNETRKSYEARIESLPVKVPAFGTIDLADHLRAITIPTNFSQAAGAGDQALALDGKILSLRILDTMIQASADVTFRRSAPATAAAPSATKASLGKPAVPGSAVRK
jgi:hypothetical protein